MPRQLATMDGNEAAAYVAYRTNEVIAIYPITPASPMGELSDLWGALDKPNVWGTVPRIIEMQSEGGAAGAVHGALQAGALTTTFTASQGLLLMVPNMYKIAGELTPTVFHISARSIAAQALSIFGDHSDVMAARSTGWGMLFANSVQEAMDFSMISQAATLKTRIPFLHIFDGFRTSHELQKIELLDDDDIRAMLDDDSVRQHRMRAMTPDNPVVRGTAQNPDVFFQARESVNPFYDIAPDIVQETMDAFAARVGRKYRLFDYVGAPDADRIIIQMGSGCETADETVTYLADKGESVGLIKVRLFRPFSGQALLDAIPDSVKSIAVLDRTKEPGGAGEPLYQDVVTALGEAMATGQRKSMPLVRGGRYGLSSKEYTPAMVKSIFDHLGTETPKNHFTVGIHDDVTHSSLEWDPSFTTEADDVTRAVFWGLGADGTVGANKNSIKIIGGETDNYAQGYFVYDSKKSGARTISHLRFGPNPIKSTYLIETANFVAVHQFGFMRTYDTLAMADKGATFLLNSPFGPDEVWDELPHKVQKTIIEKKLKMYVIDALSVARDVGLGGRTNTIMQTCFFALSGILSREDSILKIKEYIRKTYGRRGKAVVEMNNAAVDAALDHMHEVAVPAESTSTIELPLTVAADAPDFVQEVTAQIMAGLGDDLPVSKLPIDGTYPSGTTQWEKRNLATEIPVWEPDLCIQCGKCVMVCPHSTIRAKVVQPALLADAPEAFKSIGANWRQLPDQSYTIQVAAEDCTGCKLCVEICPAKDKSRVGRKALNMAPQLDIRDEQRINWDFFLGLPEINRYPVGGDGADSTLKFTKAKDVQLLQPLFEFSGACAGCGETPYIRLLTQLYGDRMLIANATGCSSIYGGNLPTTPYSVNRAGRGPTWNNSLFEDNAEFGLGMRLSVDKQREYAEELVASLKDEIGEDLADGLLGSSQKDDAGIAWQRDRVELLKARLKGNDSPKALDLMGLADALVDKTVWIVGGDGWAYDIGYGGLDHVLASNRNVNILVLDTEVYSNTGGQASKATHLGAVAKFAAGGKPTPKKDLGLIAMSYGYAYVAQIAMGADENQTLKALREAQEFDGPSIVIAYSHCIAHGIDMSKGMDQQAKAVKSGYWPMFRYDPRLKEAGKNPLQLDYKAPSIPVKDYIYNENRFRMLRRLRPEAADGFLKDLQTFVKATWEKYQGLASDGPAASGKPGGPPPPGKGPGAPPPAAPAAAKAPSLPKAPTLPPKS